MNKEHPIGSSSPNINYQTNHLSLRLFGSKMVNGENLIEQCAIKPRTVGNESGKLNDTDIVQIVIFGLEGPQGEGNDFRTLL